MEFVAESMDEALEILREMGYEIDGDGFIEHLVDVHQGDIDAILQELQLNEIPVQNQQLGHSRGNRRRRRRWH